MTAHVRTVSGTLFDALEDVALLDRHTWCDLAPHFACDEADKVERMLRLTREPWVADGFRDAHAIADDEPDDWHHCRYLELIALEEDR